MVQALLPFNPAFRAQVAIFAGDWCGSMSSVRLLCVGRSATCQNSVIIGPGHTARTLIFLGFNSSRSAREKLCTYAFVEQYTAMRGVGANDAMDEMFRISPPVFNRTLDWYDRRIMLYNDSTPYLTYAEMQSSDFLTKLNKNYQSGSSYKSFSTVTITEQGQNIDGKYSFPGNDTALQGLNYPFPTVLTQTDIFGSTVNLHYGRWPRIGLLWEENSRKLDLLADIKTKAEDSTLNDNEDGKALLQTHLLIASSDVDTSAVPPEIKLYDENRNELTNDKAAATVSRIVYNRENNCYDVTFIGQNVGTVVAEAKLGNYIARLTIEVTASLKLEASSTNISVYSGDTDTITLTVKDANDKQLLVETEKTLRWEIAVDNNGVQQDVIECSKDDIKLNADGTFSLPLTGFAAGEATVSITCTYPYGAATAAEPAKEVTATLYISATTKPSDVLGLTNGSVYNQISLPHTPKKSTTSYTGTTVEYPENRPAMQGSALFLYATDAYTDLKGFTVDQIEITAGETTYTVGEDGITTDENHTYKVTVNDKWTTETNDTKFQYRAVKVESAAAGEITLKIVLKNGDVTYNLITPYTIVSNEYKVKFTFFSASNPYFFTIAAIVPSSRISSSVCVSFSASTASPSGLNATPTASLYMFMLR